MTTGLEKTAPPKAPLPSGRGSGPRRSLRSSLAAHGEPMVWLMGGALGIAICMIVGLLLLIFAQGFATFWPGKLVMVKKADGTLLMGEPTREERFRPEEDAIAAMPEAMAARVRSEMAADPEGVRRRLLRIGNYELTGNHFLWVDDHQVVAETEPEWAMVVQRLEWWRFQGTPVSLALDGVEQTREPQEIWTRFGAEHPAVRARHAERRRLENDVVGDLAAREEAARLEHRQAEIDHGPESPAAKAAARVYEDVKARTEAEFAEVRNRIAALQKENDRLSITFQTADGQEKAIKFSEIVSMYPANRLSWSERFGVYLDRWSEFLGDEPRSMNTEGGVYPAIFGTVLMTLVMSLLVVPFGVLAALYLREYAKAGPIISTIRIAVNNLAGVPSIVFGVFGMGFFCYIVGATIDRSFFEARLPNPTFGKGGLMWASFTLALLTLPVVIVAVEEALAAVPNSMREGSYACGASKWQTIRRIVLPRAMPGILTGAILAIARGAGEVAPLMLVGALKLAPVPVDGVFPFVHPEKAFMHLGFYIFDLGFQSPDSEAAKPMVFTTTLLLIVVIATLNVAAVLIRSRLRRRFAGGQF